MNRFMKLPDNLPVPLDDGACAHLQDSAIPEVKLRSTKDRNVDLQLESRTPTILFFYPRTGEPGKPAEDDWDLIPGARGCTPQSCSFRDLHQNFKSKGYKIFGISCQSSEYQKEFAQRNQIPFEILSDENFKLTELLKLPTFDYRGNRLIKRLALVLNHGRIEKVFYPVFPPDKNAEVVFNWLLENHR